MKTIEIDESSRLVGLSIPQDTAHVRSSIRIPVDECLLRLAEVHVRLHWSGRERVIADMESQCGLRRGRGLGLEQDADRVSTVSCDPDDTRTRCGLRSCSSFFVHKSIQSFADAVIQKHGRPDEKAFLFPSHPIAKRCMAFLHSQEPSLEPNKSVRILDLSLRSEQADERQIGHVHAKDVILSAVIFPAANVNIVKTFWQHSGEGISSRRAEYCRKAFDEGHLIVRETASTAKGSSPKCKGPRRYRKHSSMDLDTRPSPGQGQDPTTSDGHDSQQYVEERFGRNLDIALANSAKTAIRRRIAGALCANVDLEDALQSQGTCNGTPHSRRISEEDVYLFPSGMSSIFNAHRTLLNCRGQLKSVSFGFPYIDTLKILEKWGPGCIFYGKGASDDLDDLAARCERGEKFLALFCEFPGNPLLKSPDLARIRQLADRYDFAVVVDETIGNFVNVDVLPLADVVVSSLTKVFTGECNVMGGSMVLNPHSRYHATLKAFMTTDYEDNYWPEDAIVMERNSRDFLSRVHRINANAEMICDTLRASPAVKEIFYPKHSPTRPFYDRCRTEDGGYGGLLSVTFHSTAHATCFFDRLDTAKGPSLGTNFTLASPYVILAHYQELEWVQQFGVDPDLIRVSVGLEDPAELRAKVRRALDAVESSGRGE